MNDARGVNAGFIDNDIHGAARRRDSHLNSPVSGSRSRDIDNPLQSAASGNLRVLYMYG